MTATTMRTRSMSGANTPGFGSTLASEWTKLRSVRSTWIIVGLAITLSVGFSALIAFVQGVTFDDWGPNEQAVFDPLLNSTSGLLFGLILLITFGVIAVTSDYSSGTIRTTFIATPKRLRILGAKAIIIGLIGIIISAITMPAMVFVSQMIFGAYGMETVSASDEGVMRLIIVYIFAGGLIYTLIPMAIGFILRGTASAITLSIGLFFLPWMLAPLLPSWVQENIIRFLPDLAMDSLGGVTATTSNMYLSQGPAIVTISAWLIGMLVLASVMLTRKDA
jgi:ABC-2 type transport system permease protein